MQVCVGVGCTEVLVRWVDEKPVHITNIHMCLTCTGVVPRVVKVAPACAIMVGSYEAGKTYFSEQNNRGTRKGPKPDLRAID